MSISYFVQQNNYTGNMLHAMKSLIYVLSKSSNHGQQPVMHREVGNGVQAVSYFKKW